MLIPVLAKAFPRPVHSFVEGLDGDLLQEMENGRHRRAIHGSAGGDGDRAVARDHGGDTMQHRRQPVGIPTQLRVEVGVRVDEARGHDTAAGIDRLRGQEPVETPDIDDHAIGHCDIPTEPGQARAVNDQAILDQEIDRHNDPPPSVRGHS
jgi:hypothetical protein